MRSRLLTILFVVLTLAALGQTNSWINYSQDYIRFKISEEGWYRVTATELESAGFPTSIVAASRIRMYRRGSELAIRAVANANNTLNYLEFYGKGNDGASDTELYVSGGQAHTSYNLFTDTASYFLTWSQTGAGLRIQTNGNNDNTGLTVEPYHLEELEIVQTSNYNVGRRFGSGFEFQSGDYDVSEGWTGGFLSKNGFETHEFDLEGFDNSGPNPVLHLSIIGGNSLNHVIAVSAGQNTSSLVSIGQATFSGYTFTNYEVEIPWSNVGAGGELVVRMTVQGETEAADRASFARVAITYPQETEVDGSSDKKFSFEASTESRRYLNIAGTSPNTYEYFDISNSNQPLKLPSTGSNPVQLVVPNAQTDRTVLAVRNTLSVPVVESVAMNEIDFEGQDYLIITHPLLRDDDGEDPVQLYENYRESAAGGSHKVMVTEIQEVYDQFNYGDPSPLAIYKLLESGYGSIENVFLIGKGRTPNLDFFRKQFTTYVNSQAMIPPFGLPGSDLHYSLGFGSDPNVPAIPIGRLNATNAGQVTAYLNKVKEMEATGFDELWRKRAVQLSGGQTAFELTIFSNYIRDLKEQIEGNFLGADVTNQGKETSAVSEFISIADEVNNGVGLITLFGHSSTIVTDIEIGRPSQQSEDGSVYENKGRYPFIIVNGCQAGEIFRDIYSFGEDWMMTADKGSIGFLAHSYLALSSNLFRYNTLFYETAFEEEAGISKTVGDIMLEVSAKFFDRYSSGDVAKTQVYQTLFQGDPVIQVFPAVSPDFAVEEEGLSLTGIEGEDVLAQQDSFLVNVVVENFGKTVEDSMDVRVIRTLDDGTVLTYDQRFPSTKFRDTLSVIITNPELQSVQGNNMFDILVDPQDTIAELNEANNSASFSEFLSSGATFHLMPQDFGIRANAAINLIWQPIDLLEKSRGYSLEIDTASDFSSSILISEELTGEDIFVYTFDPSQFNLPDSTVVHWRTRFSEIRSGEDSVWTSSSFTLLGAGEEGWAQLSTAQLAVNELVDLNLDQNGMLSFENFSTNIDLETLGTSSYDYDNLKVVVSNTDLLFTNSFADPECAANTINAFAISRNTGQLYRPVFVSGADELQDIVCGRLPQMIYNLTASNVLTDRWIESLVNGMSNGDYMVLFNIDSVAYSQWDDAIKASLNEIGVNTDDLNDLIDGQPLIILGEKGSTEGSATVLKNDGTILPVKEQQLDLHTDLIGQKSSGTITTPAIGPARNWGEFSFDFEQGGSDGLTYRIYGINGQEKIELALETSSRTTAETIDLSTLADGYPKIQLEYQVGDNTDFSPPQLRYSIVNYTPVPEGALYVTDKDILNVQEGEDLSVNLGYWNLSGTDFEDSIRIDYTLRNLDQESTMADSITVPPLISGDTAILDYMTSSSGLAGTNRLRVRVVPNEEEAFAANNQVVFNPFAEVDEDDVNPVLDVTFDGNYILNGEIVSAEPVIRIKMKDENRLTFKDDTVGIELYWRTPETMEFQQISLSDPVVDWQPATEDQDFEIEIRRTELEDGMHALRVQAEDASGNKAGQEPYEIEFEVINESTITNFFPYPNPFSTRCRFVFTLTGSVIPDRIKIQIMTISGRVVKEIQEHEIGNLRIGNNITEYAWDGRDEFGDRLANGVYLYRVITQINGEQMEHRNTVADRAFRKGFGKLYILR